MDTTTPNGKAALEVLAVADRMREAVTALLQHQANAGPVGLLGAAAQNAVLAYDSARSAPQKAGVDHE